MRLAFHSRRRVAAAAVAVAGAALSTALAPVIALGADGNTANFTPNAVATGPTVVHDTTFTGSKVSIRSIDVPLTNLSLVVLDVSKLPEIAKLKTLGAHVHSKECAADAAASGPHHANPAAPASMPLMAKEVWLDLRVDSQGRATSMALIDWKLKKGEAGSVVIHALPTDPLTGVAGARVMCTTVPFT